MLRDRPKEKFDKFKYKVTIAFGTTSTWYYQLDTLQVRGISNHFKKRFD